MNDLTDTARPRDKTQVSSATQGAYLALRKLIVAGDLKPGEKLKIETLRDLLNIGASPIREALSLLTSDNLVERLDQRGFRAAPINRANFDEILALRCELEDMALRKSLENRTEAWEETVVLSHHRMVRAQTKDTGDFEDLHKDFHMTLLANCDWPILQKFCSQLYDLNIRYRYVAAKATNYQSRDVSSEHAAILDAIIAQDAKAASENLIGHYNKTGEYFREIFAELNLT